MHVFGVGKGLGITLKSFVVQPLMIVICWPFFAGVVRPEELVITVVNAALGAVTGAWVAHRGVKFAGEAADVTRVVEEFGDEDFVGGNGLAILATARGAWVAPSEEARSAGCADRALGEGGFKEDTFFGQAI